MSDINVEALIEENEERIQRMDKVEEKAKDEIVKYFDRIHDKLFAYQLFFLAGYISLVAIPSINVSPWLLIIPVFCVARLIHLDWRMMEHNRILSDVKNQSMRQLDQLNEKQAWTNMQSLEIILESLVTTVIFILVLLK
jgi:hypothetical protein